jgi:hypothetical protein
MLFGIRFELRGCWLYAGFWAARIVWPWTARKGRFSNGRKYWTGWHRFPEPSDF